MNRLSLTFACCTIFVMLQCSAYAMPSADFFEDLLLARDSESKSFRANYQIKQTGNDDESYNLEENHSALFFEDDYRISRQYDYSDGVKIEILAYVAGVYSTFLTGDHVNERSHAAGIIGWKDRPIPEGAYLDPRIIWGHFQGKSVRKWLERLDRRSVRQEEDAYIFSISSDESGERIDYHFSPDFGHIDALLYGYHAGEKMGVLEHLDASKKEAVRRQFIVNEAVSFEDFETIDSVSIPTLVTRGVYGPAKQEASRRSAISGRLQANPESLDSATIKEIIELNFLGSRELIMQQEMVFTPNSIKVNQPIAVEEIAIEFPEGTSVRDNIAGIGYKVGESPRLPLAELAKRGADAPAEVAAAVQENDEAPDVQSSGANSEENEKASAAVRRDDTPKGNGRSGLMRYIVAALGCVIIGLSIVRLTKSKTRE
ncbi:MAG: hypothetical protein RLY93_04615 [Sumerlaeia bacterium]